MKKLIISLILTNLLLGLALAGLAVLAEAHPFHPGSQLYPLQTIAETGRAALTLSPLKRAEMNIDLANRRLADLKTASGGTPAGLAARGLEHSLASAAACLEDLPYTQQVKLYQSIQGVLSRLEPILVSQAASVPEADLKDLKTRAAEFQQAASPAEMQEASTHQAVVPLAIHVRIPFLEVEVDHSVFPLEDGHAVDDCLSCHADGVYAGTPAGCAACHPIPVPGKAQARQARTFTLNPAYPEHFSGDCADCHTTRTWYPSTFDHREVTECISCHAEDLPSLAAVRELLSRFADTRIDTRPGLPHLLPVGAGRRLLDQAEDKHYPGDCGLCHTDTRDWSDAEYVHETPRVLIRLPLLEDDPVQFVLHVSDNCADCHDTGSPAAVPAGHQTTYEPTCTTCHLDGDSWQAISFDHTGYADCTACHAAAEPAVHYPGDCALCHDTENWNRSLFVHDGHAACQECHVAAISHYPGACTTCHDTLAWYRITYQHQPGSDCQMCHAAPPEHAAGQCSACHATMDWRDDSIYHALQTCAACHDQPQAHYPAACTVCHQTRDWIVTTVDHTGLDYCTTCHHLDVDVNSHYPAECGNCHNTQDWSSYIFSHETLYQCATCHPVPDSHFAGVCLECHISTTDWFDALFDHTNQNACMDCHTAPAEHYPGTCSECHGVTSWEFLGYVHLSTDRCTSCHVAPPGHWPGQCSNCHYTDTWLKIEFDHTTYTDCKSCHLRPPNHYRGQCSNCHVVESWTIIITKTPEPTNPTPTDTPTPTDGTPEPSDTPTPTGGTPEPSETPTPEP